MSYISGWDGIYIYSIETNSSQPLFSCGYCVGGIDLSPDGNRILYSKNTGGSFKLLSTEIESLETGDQVTNVVFGDSAGGQIPFNRFYYFKWSPDGSYISADGIGERDELGNLKPNQIYLIGANSSLPISVIMENGWQPAWQP